MTKNNSIKAVSTDKFWEVLLGDSEPELTIGSIEIHIVNGRYWLFKDKHPLTSVIGVLGRKNTTLQDAVDVALVHEFSK